MALERQTRVWALPRVSSVPNWKSLACPLSWEFKEEQKTEGKERRKFSRVSKSVKDRLRPGKGPGKGDKTGPSL